MFLQFFGFVAIRKYQALKIKIEQVEAAMHKNSCKASLVEDDLESPKQEKDAALSSHIRHMDALFAVGCGGPALIRLVTKVGFSNMFGLMAAVVELVLTIKP